MKIIVNASLVLILGSCGLSTRGNATTVLQGPTDAAMLDRIKSAIAAGSRSFRITSTGGRESDALTIAEYIENYNVNLVVDKICSSACAQYLLVAANKVTILDKSIVTFHWNSAGTLSLPGLDKIYLPNKSELLENRRRSIALYQRHRVAADFLIRSTRVLRPKCVLLESSGSKIFGEMNAWMPTIDELHGAGFHFDGYWPSKQDEFISLVQLRYRKGYRLYYGPSAPVLAGPLPRLTLCPTKPTR